MSTEGQYYQLVIEELSTLMAEHKPIRVFFAPGTETHRQLMALASQKQVEPRDIIEAAVRVFFTAWMASRQWETH